MISNEQYERLCRCARASRTDSYGLILEGVVLAIGEAAMRPGGGEQDLAGLCVRLGLSRMTAHQRGIEAGFTILDEVFGSQERKSPDG